MTYSEAVKFVVIRTIGNFLVLFSLYGVVATFGPAVYYEAAFRIAEVRGIQYTVSQPVLADTHPVSQGISFGDLLVGNTKELLVPDNTEFSIVIPKIGASARIIPNVDPNDENQFLPALKKGVAHAKGSVFPGMKGTTYLFAHSTDNFWDVGRYNAVFYLLKDLKVGDQITIFFENHRYDYQVTDTKIGDPSDVSYLVNSHSTEEKLVMQTCWPPGTTWKRLFVTAKPKKSV